MQLDQIDEELQQTLSNIQENRDLSLGKIETVTRDKRTNLSIGYTGEKSKQNISSALSGAKASGSNAIIKNSLNQGMSRGLNIVQRDHLAAENEVNTLADQSVNSANLAAEHSIENANQNYDNTVAGLPSKGSIIAGTILGATGNLLTGTINIVSNYRNQATPSMAASAPPVMSSTPSSSSSTIPGGTLSPYQNYGSRLTPSLFN